MFSREPIFTCMKVFIIHYVNSLFIIIYLESIHNILQPVLNFLHHKKLQYFSLWLTLLFVDNKNIVIKIPRCTFKSLNVWIAFCINDFWKKDLTHLTHWWKCLKEVVHFKKKLLKFTHSHVIQDVHVFLSSVEKTIKVFDENIPGFSPYNGLQWEPNEVQGPNESFSAASKCFKRHQTMNMALL